MSCSRGAWHEDAATPYAITYRWLRNGTAIPGATAATYTITTADLDTNLYCEARAESLTASQSPAVTVTAPRMVLGQVLSGQPRLRKTMSCGRGTWDDLASDRYAVTHQWLRDSVAIPDATQATYAVLATDTGQVAVLPDARGDAHADEPRQRRRDRPRAAEPDRPPPVRHAPRPPARSAAGGVTGTTRRPTATASPTAGSAAPPRSRTRPRRPTRSRPRTSSRASTAASAPRTRPTRSRPRSRSAGPTTSSRPQITGDPRLFRTLSCTRGDWDDTAADRYAVTYSWLRNSVAIPGATSANLHGRSRRHEQEPLLPRAGGGQPRRQLRRRSTRTSRGRSSRRRSPASRTCAVS